MSSTVRRLLILAATSVALALLMTTVWVRLYGVRPAIRGTGSAPSGVPAPAVRTDRYFCPMHPAMRSDRPGDCPICHMRMVPIEEEDAQESPAPSAAGSAGKKILYRSTMIPGEISDRPGKDSMGMEMVPVEMEEPSPKESPVEGHAVVRIPDRKQQLIGVATQIVRRAPFIRRAMVDRPRGTRDLDKSEVEDMLRNISAAADHYDDKLVTEFGGKKVSELPRDQRN